MPSPAPRCECGHSVWVHVNEDGGCWDEDNGLKCRCRQFRAEPREEVNERVTHGRHCPCSACKREDWTRPDLGPCGMHGEGCPAVYAPLPSAAGSSVPDTSGQPGADEGGDVNVARRAGYSSQRGLVLLVSDALANLQTEHVERRDLLVRALRFAVVRDVTPADEERWFSRMLDAGIQVTAPYTADFGGVPAPARSGLPAVREPDEPREMTAEEVERALQIGPPDFLLGEGFDAENGPGASDELRRLGEENARG